MAPARDAATASTSAADGAFVAFLCALAPRELDALYASSPWSALAVLRACDSIAKQIILRLAYVDDGADARECAKWCGDGASEDRKSVV